MIVAPFFDIANIFADASKNHFQLFLCTFLYCDKIIFHFHQLCKKNNFADYAKILFPLFSMRRFYPTRALNREKRFAIIPLRRVTQECTMINREKPKELIDIHSLTVRHGYSNSNCSTNSNLYCGSNPGIK